MAAVLASSAGLLSNAGLQAIDLEPTYSQCASPTLPPILCVATDVGMHGLLASQYRVTP